MGLQQNIEQNFIQAMRNKDEIPMAVLRMLKSALVNKKIEKKLSKDDKLPESEIIAVIKSEIKKRKDSLKTYKDAGRDDLAQREGQEIEVLEKYLPMQLSEFELKKIIEDVIKETGVSGSSDFGKVMGTVIQKTAGRADGQIVSRLVSEFLTGQS